MCFYKLLTNHGISSENTFTRRMCFQTSAVLRVSRLPLVRSALQSVASAYSGVKGRYPLLGLMGEMAEVGVRNLSHEAMKQATPLLQNLEPQSTWSVKYYYYYYYYYTTVITTILLLLLLYHYYYYYTTITITTIITTTADTCRWRLCT